MGRAEIASGDRTRRPIPIRVRPRYLGPSPVVLQSLEHNESLQRSQTRDPAAHVSATHDKYFESVEFPLPNAVGGETLRASLLLRGSSCRAVIAKPKRVVTESFRIRQCRRDL